jgi:hypothetical protein
VQDSEFIDVHSTLTTVFSVTAPLHRLPHGCGGFGLAVGGAR